jgi:hypothetical protein
MKECFAYAFYTAFNDAFFTFFFYSLAICLLILLLSILKTYFFGDFRLIEIQSLLDKEALRLAGMIVFFAFAYYSPCHLYSSLMICYTIFAVSLITLLSKRVSFLLVAPNTRQQEQFKMAILYAIMICSEWKVILLLRNEFNLFQVKPQKVLIELLLFEHIILFVRYILSFLKYTLLLFCLILNQDFRLTFSWFSTLKHSCTILSFAVRKLFLINIRFIYGLLIYLPSFQCFLLARHMITLLEWQNTGGNIKTGIN